MISIPALINTILALALAPLLPGIINRTKAIFAGRTGQPLLQYYYDLFRLFQKGAVYSSSVSLFFKAGPLVGLACMIAGLTLLPTGGISSMFGFTGDLIVLAYLMGLARFFTVAAALDTGSAFEGMGASREVQFSVLAEPALLMGLAAIGRAVQAGLPDVAPTKAAMISLSEVYIRLSLPVWTREGTVLLLTAAALFIVMLAENCRIPVDDPTTHLELTMIHEVMVLDHSGPDLGMILYAAMLKLWIFSALLAGLLIPVRSGNFWMDGVSIFAGIGMIAMGIGITESVMARLRLIRVPQLLAGALVLSVLALVLVLWG